MRLAVGACAALLVAGLGAACSGERMLPADTRPPAPTPSLQPTARAPVLAENRDYRFPVDGDTSYGATHHDYPATDIFADCGTAVVAPVSGTVVGVRRTDRYTSGVDDPALRGGRSWTLVGDDGVRYYGSHLAAVEPSIGSGTWVRAGQRLGRVGQSGNAAGVGCHLHFGVSPVCAGDGDPDSDWWIRRGVIPTYPYLQAWADGRDRSPAGEAATWQQRNGCPPAPAG